MDVPPDTVCPGGLGRSVRQKLTGVDSVGKLRAVKFTLRLFCVGLGCGITFLSGCAVAPRVAGEPQVGESVVFVGEQPAALAWLPLPEQPVTLRSTYLSQPGTLVYLEGRDYVVDYVQGKVRRLQGSRLPDFQTNMLYKQEEFDHSKFPGFGNGPFFAFADYSFAPPRAWPRQAPQASFLKSTQTKLAKGSSVKIVAFGDSITAGGDVSKPELIFWRRWVDDLQRKYPAARISAVNGATGGDSTIQGKERLQAKVLEEKPDLVLIGFGMNDHNVMGVPIEVFEMNLQEMIRRIRSRTGAEVVLFSAFPPNPKWKFGTHRMAEYAAATERVAREMRCAFADVFSNWQSLAARKKPEDLLGNNINHPNDFGHWIYFRVLQELKL
jgi:acyl-CoA thioesterase I